jgi:aspartate dehydrogenase
MKQHRIAVIGHGAIARELVERLYSHTTLRSLLAVVFRAQRTELAVLPNGVLAIRSIEALIDFKPDLVIEAAGQAAVREYAPACLKSGLTFMAASVGALADDELRTLLTQNALQGQGRLILPSGAVAGLDYISAVKRLPSTRVTYESRKPPSAWQDELQKRGLAALPTEVITLFEGAAGEAAKLFPQNLNVAATLAMAGLGMDNTRVRVLVDPKAKGNEHHIEVSGEAGHMKIELRNKPSPDNPKTSWVVGLSVLAAVERHFSPVVVG